MFNVDRAYYCLCILLGLVEIIYRLGKVAALDEIIYKIFKVDQCGSV